MRCIATAFPAYCDLQCRRLPLPHYAAFPAAYLRGLRLQLLPRFLPACARDLDCYACLPLYLRTFSVLPAWTFAFCHFCYARLHSATTPPGRFLSASCGITVLRLDTFTSLRHRSRLFFCLLHSTPPGLDFTVPLAAPHLCNTTTVTSCVLPFCSVLRFWLVCGSAFCRIYYLLLDSASAIPAILLFYAVLGPLPAAATCRFAWIHLMTFTTCLQTACPFYWMQTPYLPACHTCGRLLLLLPACQSRANPTGWTTGFFCNLFLLHAILPVLLCSPPDLLQPCRDSWLPFLDSPFAYYLYLQPGMPGLLHPSPLLRSCRGLYHLHSFLLCLLRSPFPKRSA